MYRLIYRVLFATIITSSALCHADVGQAYVWLANQQQTDGSVISQNTIAHPFQATTETLETFAQDQNALGLDHTGAQTYITQNQEFTTEFLARAIMAGIQGNNSVNSFLERLKTHQHTDGGFGSAAGYSSNVLDTAMAIPALSMTKQENSLAIGRAIQFLLAKQSTEGAFTLYLSNTPSLPLTAQVSIALQHYIFDYQGVSESVTAANEYLLANQTLGTNREDHWQTALSLLAVIPIMRDSTRYADAVNNLTDNQQPDGSWSMDVYTTALATRALYLAANITFPEEPTTGTFSGQIFDLDSNIPIKNVSITATGNHEFTTSSEADGRFSLKDLEPGDYTVNYQYPGYAGAIQSATAVVGQLTNLGNIRLQRLPDTGIISGTVSNAVSEQALPDATIVFSSTDTTVTLVSDSSGTYSTALAPASYSFTVSADGFQSVSGTATVIAGNNLLFSPGLYPVNEIPPMTTVTLSGLVVDAENTSPVSNATVQVSGNSTGVVTDNSGAFILEGLPVGEINFSISANEYITQHLQIIAPAAGQISVGSISLVRSNTQEPTSNTLFGVITNNNTGEPIGGVTLTVEETGATTQSLADGSYTLTDITPLNFTLFISAPGYWSQWSGFNFSEYGSTQYDLALTPSNLSGFGIDQLSTEQNHYEAYKQVLISANLVNEGDTTKSVRLFLEISNANDDLITGIPIGDLTGGLAPGDAINILPDQSKAVEAQWFTGIEEPGLYTAKLAAYDEFSSQLLAENITQFEIIATQNLDNASLQLNKQFSRVGITENMEVIFKAVNRSNIPITFDIDYQWNDPDTMELRSGTKALSFSPNNTTLNITLDQFLFTFAESGVYPFLAEINNSPITTAIENISVSVAPTVRVEAAQDISPVSVVPDGDKTIRIKIQVEGVEQ